ncbi:MAG TPA: hypothetical protein VFU21_20540 [Kofleriaceae bacterium]|nr:hypothetical protein [Kofleriaceae bacterium]
MPARQLIALLALAAAACASEPQRTKFSVTFTVNPAEPLAGVTVSLDGGKTLGTTGKDGALRVTLSGREGTTVPFRVRCPDGYRQPASMPILTLRRFKGLDPAAAGIKVSIECPPAERLAALVVRTGRPDLPVLAQGREVARTDADGVAHALMSMPPNSTFRVVIDTSQAPDLRPQSPPTTLTVADADDIFLIDQQFQQEAPPKAAPPPRKKVAKKKVVKKKPPVKGPTLPEKLGSSKNR